MWFWILQNSANCVEVCKFSIMWKYVRVKEEDWPLVRVCVFTILQIVIKAWNLEQTLTRPHVLNITVLPRRKTNTDLATQTSQHRRNPDLTTQKQHRPHNTDTTKSKIHNSRIGWLAPVVSEKTFFRNHTNYISMDAEVYLIIFHKINNVWKLTRNSSLQKPRAT